MNFFVFFALLVGLSCCYSQHVSENGNAEKLTQREELRKIAHRRSDSQSSFASKRSSSEGIGVPVKYRPRPTDNKEKIAGIPFGYRSEFTYVKETDLSEELFHPGKPQFEGECNITWAFTAMSMLDFSLYLRNKDLEDEQLKNFLSVQQLIDCSDNAGCGGGSIETALAYFSATKDYALQEDYIYKADKESCNAGTASEKKVSIGSVKVFSGPATEESIINMLRTVGPVGVKMISTSRIKMKNTGIFNQGLCARRDLLGDNADFSVLIVGYGVDGDTQAPYWLVKTSVDSINDGTGYFKILRGNGVCNIESDKLNAYAISTKECSSAPKDKCDGHGCFWCDSKNACLDVSQDCEECFDMKTCGGNCKMCGKNCVSKSIGCDEPCECNSGPCCDGCHYLSADTICWEAQGICEENLYCTGTSSECPSRRKFLPDTTICRPVGHENCDKAEYCTGDSPDCPPDVTMNDGITFGSTGNKCRCRNGDCFINFCSSDIDCLDSVCSVPSCLSGKCSYEITNGVSGTVCRPRRGLCDIEERCKNGNAYCPPDELVGDARCPESSRVGECKEEERCTKKSALCVTTYKSSEHICRAASTDCDEAETCTGYSSECPDDKTKEGQTCKNDVFENPKCAADKTCKGENNGICNSDEDCDNGKKCSSYKCVEHKCVYTPLPKTTLCRKKENYCDIAEYCDGISYDCPEDVKKPGCIYIPPALDFSENKTNDSLNIPLIIIIAVAAFVVLVILIIVIVVIVKCAKKHKNKAPKDSSGYEMN